MRRRSVFTFRTALLMAMALLFFLFMFTPVYWMVATSLMTESEMLTVPPHFYPQQHPVDQYR